MARCLLVSVIMFLLQSPLRVIQGGRACAGGIALKTRKANLSSRLTDLKVDNSISYQTLRSECGLDTAISKPFVAKNPNDQIVPISNIPDIPVNAADTSDGAPSKRDFTIYRLRRQVAALRENEKQLLGKLTRVSETLADQKCFIELGLTYDQWETYGELSQRLVRLKAALDLISDPNANPPVLTEEEYQKLKLKL